MNQTLKLLVELQGVIHHYEENGPVASDHARVEQLRAKVPANILRRFDHLAERRRFPVAELSNSGACGNCHLKLTPSDVLRFRRALQSERDAVSTCPFCGSFLYSPGDSLQIKDAAHE